MLCKSAASYVKKKPVLCPDCKRGKIINIPANSVAVISRRGKPPPDKQDECLDIKCYKCGSVWSFTIE